MRALVLAVLITPGGYTHAGAQPVGRICANPAHPCPGFHANDLSFVLDRRPIPRAEQRSAAFYAVILRSAPNCGILEPERVAAQAQFPGRKVFSSRFECDEDVENNVSYTGVAEHTAFLAVYAGATRPAAAAFLRTVVASRRWPGANLRLMRVVFNYD
jgi:hypothetical protein